MKTTRNQIKRKRVKTLDIIKEGKVKWTSRDREQFINTLNRCLRLEVNND